MYQCQAKEKSHTSYSHIATKQGQPIMLHQFDVRLVLYTILNWLNYTSQLEVRHSYLQELYSFRLVAISA